MAGKLMTRSGLRSLAPATALPREVKASAQTIEAVGQKTSDLIRASSPEDVQKVLSESYLQTVADLSIPVAPLVSHWAFAQWVGQDGNDTTMADDEDCDLWKEQSGALASNVYTPLIKNDLHEDNKPNDAFILQNIGCFVMYKGPLGGIADFLASFILEIHQGELRLMRVPVTACITGLVQIDNAASPTAPLIHLTTPGGGGYEVEGGGQPVRKAEITTSIRLVSIVTPSLIDAGTGLSTWASMAFHFDGEKMEP